MVPLLLIAVFIIDCVNGRPPLDPLPMKDVNLLRVEGDAVIFSFPMFETVLQAHNLLSPTTKYIIVKGNRTEGVTYGGEGRVQQHGRQLWLLPAQASDSGEYTSIYRNETHCAAGSINLQVYESNLVDLEKLSYFNSGRLGQKETIKCPSLSSFNWTEQIEWYKHPSPTALRLDTGQYHGHGARLTISDIKLYNQGHYTCKVKVLINNQQYKVSRTIQFTTSRPAGDLLTTSEPNLHSTMDTPVIQPPVIVSPLNGTIFESAHGSGLELFCKVLTQCQTVDSTVVTWLVNGQTVEASYLDQRALQGGRRVTTVPGGCQVEVRLVVIAMTEEDTEAELKCVTQNQQGGQEIVAHLRLEDSMFTWLVVGLVALSCVLTVISVFLHFIRKNRRKTNYILARQTSMF
ncbi:interleukin-1 receptor type 2-like [Diretmus argenteus]